MEMIIVFATLLLTLALFIYGKIRHDLVSMISLLVLVIAGIVPMDEAFYGFAHPAVITVAMILIVSAALQESGLVDLIGSVLLKAGNNMLVQIASLCLVVCVLSAFMNNVGALAVLMPVAIHIARKNGHPPSKYLMPLAFSSLLGGLITLIGTPPNIIISAFRQAEVGEAYGIFEFAWVGLPLALLGLIMIITVGLRLLPKRTSGDSSENIFHIEEYTTEVEIKEGSPLVGKKIDYQDLSKMDVTIIELIRDERWIQVPAEDDQFKTGDILVVEADSSALKNFVEKTKNRLFARQEVNKLYEGESELTMMEVVVKDNSPLINQTASSMRLRTRFGINLLAIARNKRKMRKRLDHIKFISGDVLLLHGYKNGLLETMDDLECLPLADRGFDINKPKKILRALLIFVASLVLIITGLLKVQIAFSLAALFMVLFRVLPLKKLYTSVNWPVIILLGALLPVGKALEETGGASFIADKIYLLGNSAPLWFTLALFLTITMLLSAIINNAATVVIMAPIGINLAYDLGASADSFLMAAAIGSSCAFLSPIGHQSNTLVMGPGGYRFTDYTRMGLPITVLTAVAGTILIIRFWT